MQTSSGVQPRCNTRQPPFFSRHSNSLEAHTQTCTPFAYEHVPVQTKQNIAAAVAAVVEGVHSYGGALTEATDRAVAQCHADILDPFAAKITDADNQLSDLVMHLGEVLLATDDDDLMTKVSELETKASHLLALTPATLTAPRPALSCVLKPSAAVAAVKASLRSPVVSLPKPWPSVGFESTLCGASTLCYHTASLMC